MNATTNVNTWVNTYANANMNAAHVPLQRSRVSMYMPISLMSLFFVTHKRRYFIFCMCKIYVCNKYDL